MASTAAPLAAAVSSLQSSLSLLSSSISTLDAGVQDFPRLAHVLQTTRHFDLVPESELQAAQAALLASLAPELHALLGRVEVHNARLARRRDALKAQAELQRGRLEGRPSSSSAAAGAAGGRGGRGRAMSGTRGAAEDGGEGDAEADSEGLGERDVLKLKSLRQRRERLEFAVERLTLQARQRERELRKSVAAT